MIDIKAFSERVIGNLEKVIVGKRQSVELIVIGLLCQGHVLIEDVPGVGKTMLARSLARSLDCVFNRIQFTPDMLPSDVTGVSIYNQQKNKFEFRPGPVIGQIILADEINRATPKTQAALLEAMEERQVTVDGVTHILPKPFMVLATQNPIEYEGTFPLPEAQLDRFLLRLRLGYPSMADEIRVMDDQRLHHPLEALKPVVKLKEIQQAIGEFFAGRAASNNQRQGDHGETAERRDQEQIQVTPQHHEIEEQIATDIDGGGAGQHDYQPGQHLRGDELQARHRRDLEALEHPVLTVAHNDITDPEQGSEHDIHPEDSGYHPVHVADPSAADGAPLHGPASVRQQQLLGGPALDRKIIDPVDARLTAIQQQIELVIPHPIEGLSAIWILDALDPGRSEILRRLAQVAGRIDDAGPEDPLFIAGKCEADGGDDADREDERPDQGAPIPVELLAAGHEQGRGNPDEIRQSVIHAGYAR